MVSQLDANPGDCKRIFPVESCGDRVGGSLRPAFVRRLFLEPWLVAYIGFAACLAFLCTLRLLWSWPDTAWQTTVLFIDEIEQVLQGNWASALWIGTGGEHALTGYRWFQDINAVLFGLNSHVEIVIYYLLIFVLMVAIGRRVLKRLHNSNARPFVFIPAFTIPVVLASMVGAGSRGMELGQYFGVTCVVLLLLWADSEKRRRNFIVWSMPFVLALTFLVLGSYAIACAATLLFLSVIASFWPAGLSGQRRDIYALAIAATVSALAWISVMAPNIAGNSLAELINQLTLDPLFFVRYLSVGFASAVISSNTIEMAGCQNWVVWTVAGLVLAFWGTSLLSFFRHPDKGSIPALGLMVYAFLQSGVLMCGRHQSDLYLLSPWYSFHFKLGLVGATWLLLNACSRRDKSSHVTRPDGLMVVSFVLLVAIQGTVLWANQVQWHRQPHERQYFQNVIFHALHPEQLAADAGGNTPLVMSLDSSKHVIEVLKRYHLSVYRSPAAER